MSNESPDFSGLDSSQKAEAAVPDLDFEKKRLVRAVEDAATALNPDDLKEALSQGLGNTHLTVVDEPDEPISLLLDINGKPKRGARYNMTREEVIETLRLSEKQKRVARALNRLQNVSSISLGRPDKSDDTL